MVPGEGTGSRSASGSTGMHRAVMVTHRNIMANPSSIIASLALDETERRRSDERLGNIRRLLESREVLLIDVTPPIVRKATEFRQNKKPKRLPDAIHLATAVLNRCDWLVTFDDDFPDVDGLLTFRWAQLLDPQVSLPWAIAVQGSLFPVPGNLVPVVGTHP